MGALHRGHLSLVKKSMEKADVTVVSIFVNPLQFNDPEDYKRYPRSPEKDIELLGGTGCDIVFLPEGPEEVYHYADERERELAGERIKSFFEGYGKDEILNSMEARYRPGHFNGVIAVIERLFSLVGPDIAFFGEKDYQQYLIVKAFSGLCFPSIEIEMVETVREDNGLALSSRNMLLNGADRGRATVLYRALRRGLEMYRRGIPLSKIYESINEMVQTEGLVLEYFEIRDNDTLSKDEIRVPRAFICAYAGGVRLIDNAK